MTEAGATHEVDANGHLLLAGVEVHLLDEPRVSDTKSSRKQVAKPDMEGIPPMLQRNGAAKPDVEALLARIAQLEAEVHAYAQGLSAVSLYGLGRFPLTLYGEQWGKVLGMADEIKAFIEANRTNSARSERNS